MTSKPGYLLAVVASAVILAIGYFTVMGFNEQKTAVDADKPDVENQVAEPEFVVHRPERPSDGFVGSRACRKCHADISDEYDTHPMGRSMAAASDKMPALMEDASKFSVAPEPGFRRTYQYEAIVDDGKMVHRESATTRDTNDPIYQIDVPVDFAIGSGKRGKSYITNHNGILTMSPMTWYSQGNRWDLSPGYELQNHHFQRRIVDGCVQCHASRAANRPESTHLFEKKPFHELAIGCERCHGPGAAHVDFHSADNMAQNTADPIVNPIKLDGDLGNHVCFQCHLIGEFRLPRYGRTDFDFRPGDRVTDIWTTFLKGTGVDESGATEAVSQVEQMTSSECYKNSNGAFGCVSCHNPHKTPTAKEQHEFYRDKCLECHGPKDTECSELEDVRLAAANPNSCIECHMPTIPANDVPHTSQTDHRILKRPLAATPKAVAGNHQVRIFEVTNADITPPEIDRADAIQMVRTAEATGNDVMAAEAIPVLELWVKNVKDDLPAIEALGTALFLVGDMVASESVWKTGLNQLPTDERFLKRLFVMYHENGRLPDALLIGKRLIEINDFDYQYHGRLAHIQGQMNRTAGGLKSALRAIEINPSVYMIHGWLAEIYAAMGDEAASKTHQNLYDLLAPSQD